MHIWRAMKCHIRPMIRWRPHQKFTMYKEKCLTFLSKWRIMPMTKNPIAYLINGTGWPFLKKKNVPNNCGSMVPRYEILEKQVLGFSEYLWFIISYYLILCDFMTHDIVSILNSIPLIKAYIWSVFEYPMTMYVNIRARKIFKYFPLFWGCMKYFCPFEYLLNTLQFLVGFFGDRYLNTILLIVTSITRI